ncbi:MAG: hypothetical protein LBB23_01100 [Rickettsiales bacterium]|jgi:hypothetical protein|nr:hypothetical protein [Rickettsiales bacterium]
MTRILISEDFAINRIGEDAYLDLSDWQISQVLAQLNSPTFRLNAPSFVKVSDNEIKIYGNSYLPSQIISISSKGHSTLDGNEEYYYKPEYPFCITDYDYVQDKFGRIVDFGKEYKINITQALIIPTAWNGENADGKRAGEAVPQQYNFNCPDEHCNVLVIPCEDDIPLNCGAFADNKRNIGQFVWHVGRSVVDEIGGSPYFRSAFRNAIESASKNKEYRGSM